MPNLERVRECVSGLPSSEYFAAKAEAGWSRVTLRSYGAKYPSISRITCVGSVT